MCVYVPVCVHMRMCAHARICMCARVCAHVCAHVCPCLYALTIFSVDNILCFINTLLRYESNIDQVKLIISMDTDRNVDIYIYSCLLTANNCFLFLFYINLHWCNLLTHVVSMIVRAV